MEKSKDFRVLASGNVALIARVDENGLEVAYAIVDPGDRVIKWLGSEHDDQ